MTDRGADVLGAGITRVVGSGDAFFCKQVAG